MPKIKELEMSSLTFKLRYAFSACLSLSLSLPPVTSLSFPHLLSLSNIHILIRLRVYASINNKNYQFEFFFSF